MTTHQSQPDAAISIKPLRILIAEDNEANTFFLMKTLKKQGHEVVCSDNGETALETWRAQPFDYILMDIQMPKMSGEEAVRIIRNEEKDKGTYTRIIALTAHALDGDREHFLESGFDGYLSKPFRIEALLEFLQAQ